MKGETADHAERKKMDPFDEDSYLGKRKKGKQAKRKVTNSKCAAWGKQYWKYSACLRILHYVVRINFTTLNRDQIRMKYFFQAFKTQQNRYHHKAEFFFCSPFPPKWSQPAALWITLNPVRVIHYLCFEIQWYYCCTCRVPLPNLLAHLKKLCKQTPNQSPIFAIFVE